MGSVNQEGARKDSAESPGAKKRGSKALRPIKDPSMRGVPLDPFPVRTSPEKSP